MKPNSRPNGGACRRLMFSLAAVLALFAVSTSYGLYRINAIGGSIKEIAEIHIPLTELITRMESYQLQRSVLLERTLRLGKTMTGGEGYRNRFGETADEYRSFADEVGEALSEGEKLTRLAVRAALSEKTRTSMEDIGRRLGDLAQEHRDVDHHAREVLKLLDQGQVSEADVSLERLEQAEEGVDRDLEDLLMQVERLTEETVLRAERSETQAYLWMLIFAGFAFSAIPDVWQAVRNSGP